MVFGKANIRFATAIGLARSGGRLDAFPVGSSLLFLALRSVLYFCQSRVAGRSDEAYREILAPDECQSSSSSILARVPRWSLMACKSSFCSLN